MSTLNLASQLRQAIDNIASFENHPLKSAKDQDKINYLKGLSLLVMADEQKADAEVSSLGRLYRTIVPAGEPLEQLLSFAEQPDFNAVGEIWATLNRHDELAGPFLLDLVMLAAADGDIVEQEWALIAACRALFGWDHELFNRACALAEQIAVSAEGEELAETLTCFPAAWTDHILQYRGLPRQECTGCSEEWSLETVRENWPQGREEKRLQDILAQAGKDSAAARLKTAIDGVLDLPEHPLDEADLPDRMNYLKALCLVMTADGEITPEEQAYFGAVVRTLVGAEAVAELTSFSQNPDFGDLPGIIESLAKKEEYQTCLVIDAAMLAAVDNEVHEQESALIDLLREMIDWDKPRFTTTLKRSLALAQCPAGLVFFALAAEFPKPLTEHIRTYRGIPANAPDPLTELHLGFTGLESMSYGEVTNGNQVALLPVTVQQFFPYLRCLQLTKGLEQRDNCLYLASGEALLAMACNGLSLVDADFRLDEEKAGLPLLCFSPFAATGYCSWLSALSGKDIVIPHVKGDSSTDVSRFLGEQFPDGTPVLLRWGSEGRAYLPTITIGRYCRMKDENPVPETDLCPAGFLLPVTRAEEGETEGEIEDPTIPGLFLAKFLQSTVCRSLASDVKTGQLDSLREVLTRRLESLQEGE